MLGLIQNDLFDLGADLAVPQREGKAERLRMLSSQVERLERDIDSLNEKLAPLTSFVLPGGTPAAAYLHVARTICRRAERVMVELAAKPEEPVSEAAIQYMNRLSDFLFVPAARPITMARRRALGARPEPLRAWLGFSRTLPGQFLAFRALTGGGRDL